MGTQLVRIRIGLDGTSSVLHGLSLLDRGSERLARKFGIALRAGSAFGAGLGRTLGAIDRALSSAGGDLVRKGAGKILSLSEALADLQTAASLSDDEARALKDDVFALAKAANVMPDDILGGLQAIQDFSGDLGFARENMLMIARAARGTTTPVKDLALITADLGEKFGVTGDALERMLASLIEQGDIASVPLNTMAAEISELSALTVGMGGKTPDAMRKIAAAFQVVRKAGGSAAEATTMLKALLRDIPRVAPKLKSLGVDVFSVRDGKKELRAVDELLLDIVRVSGASKIKALKLGFTDEAASALTAFGGAGALDTFAKLNAAMGDGGTIAKKFGTRTRGEFGKIGAAVTDLKILAEEANEALLRGAVDKLADHEKEFRTVLETVGAEAKRLGSGLGAGEVLAAAGGAAALGTLATLFRGATSGLDDLAGFGADEQRVFVVNWPGSPGGDGGGVGGRISGGVEAAVGSVAGSAAGAIGKGALRAAPALAGLGPPGAALALGALAVGGGMAIDSAADAEVREKLTDAVLANKKMIDELRGLVGAGKLKKGAARHLLELRLSTNVKGAMPWWANSPESASTLKSLGRSAAWNAFEDLKSPGAGTGGWSHAVDAVRAVPDAVRAALTGLRVNVSVSDGAATATLSSTSTRSVPVMAGRT